MSVNEFAVIKRKVDEVPSLGRVLIAEDVNDIREHVRCALDRAGFHVQATCDGEEAWDAITEKGFDLLITDIQMPRLNGIELVHRIRAAGIAIPIIIASGSVEMMSLHQRASLQAAAFLQKPFTISELFEVVDVILPVVFDAAEYVGPAGFPRAEL